MKAILLVFLFLIISFKNIQAQSLNGVTYDNCNYSPFFIANSKHLISYNDTVSLTQKLNNNIDLSKRKLVKGNLHVQILIKYDGSPCCKRIYSEDGITNKKTIESLNINEVINSLPNFIIGNPQKFEDGYFNFSITYQLVFGKNGNIEAYDFLSKKKI